MKRLFDIVLSISGLLLFFPVGILIMAIIAIVDPGPPFYKHERVGKNGQKFFLWKFRTMRVHQPTEGEQITHGSRDPRITPMGYYLRMLKLDEVPQLFNVIKGEMSLVGPRPEVEKYVSLYNEEQKRVLSVPPGCTDITVIRGHLHDAALLDRWKENAEEYYIKTLMPRKLSHNLYYVDNQSLLLDLKILVGTILLMLGVRKNQAMTSNNDNQ